MTGPHIDTNNEGPSANDQHWQERERKLAETAHHIREMLAKRGITEDEIMRDFALWRRRRK